MPLLKDGYNYCMKDTTSHDISTLAQLSKFTQIFLSSLKIDNDVATLVTLSGDLGAGKTTFTQMIAESLGVESEVTSPTYVIEQRYACSKGEFKTLVHIDAYRLENEDDPYKIGLDHTLSEPGNLVVIEWPEKISGFLDSYRKINITITLDGDRRTLVIQD